MVPTVMGTRGIAISMSVLVLGCLVAFVKGGHEKPSTTDVFVPPPGLLSQTQTHLQEMGIALVLDEKEPWQSRHRPESPCIALSSNRPPLLVEPQTSGDLKITEPPYLPVLQTREKLIATVVDAHWLPVQIAQVDTRKGEIALERSVLDLGDVAPGSIVERDLSFRNLGSGPLRITDAKASCSCLTAAFNKDEVPPGESGSIRIRYNSEGVVGQFETRLIFGMSGRTQLGMISVQGQIQGSVVARPAQVHFGRVTATKGSLRQIRLLGDRKTLARASVQVRGSSIEAQLTESNERTIIDCRPRSGATMGQFKDTVLINFEDQSPQIEIPVSGEMISAVQTTPPVIVVAGLQPRQVARRNVYACSQSPMEVHNLELKLENGVGHATSVPENAYLTRIEVEMKSEHSGIVRGFLELFYRSPHPGDPGTISIPILVTVD